MSILDALRRSPILTTALTVVALDQATKLLVLERIPLHSRIPLIDGLFAFTHVHNRGMAFGLFNTVDGGWLRWVLVAVAIAAVAIIWSYARQEAGRTAVMLGFGAVLGGAIGNLIDRLRFGYVVDFVLAHWGPHEFPAFNVADAAITMGGITLFVALAREDAPSGSDDRPDANGPSDDENSELDPGEIRHDHV